MLRSIKRTQLIKSFLFIFLAVSISACSSVGRDAPPYYKVAFNSYLNDQVETSISATTTHYCINHETNEYSDECKLPDARLFRDPEHAIQFAKKVAEYYCPSGIAERIGYRKNEKYIGSSPISCIEEKYSGTVCDGGDALFTIDNITTWKCQQPIEVSTYNNSELKENIFGINP